MKNLFNWFIGLFKKKDAAPAAGAVTPAWPAASDSSKTIPPSSDGAKKLPPSRPLDLPSTNHYQSRSRSKMVAEFEYLYPLAVVQPHFVLEAARAVEWAQSEKLAFNLVAKETNIPWWLVATINSLEMGRNMNGTILNGEPWKQKTKKHPAGLGPWKNWVEAAVWGLRYGAKQWGFDLAKWSWGVGDCFYFAESWNGHGARSDAGKDFNPPYASAYIYSATQFYSSGKFVEVETKPGSGKYKSVVNRDLVSQQLGVMAFAKALEKAGEKLF